MPFWMRVGQWSHSKHLHKAFFHVAYEFLAPVLLLPANIDEQSLMYPSKPPNTRPEMFQAIQLCSSCRYQ
jgi:hypothetical protein